MEKVRSSTMVKFTSRGRVTLPANLRRRYGIEAKTKAMIEATEEGILIKPVNKDYVRGLRGSLQVKGPSGAMNQNRHSNQES